MIRFVWLFFCKYVSFGVAHFTVALLPQKFMIWKKQVTRYWQLSDLKQKKIRSIFLFYLFFAYFINLYIPILWQFWSYFLLISISAKCTYCQSFTSLKEKFYFCRRLLMYCFLSSSRFENLLVLLTVLDDC